MTRSVRRILIAAIALLLSVPGVALLAGPAGKGVLVATIAAPIGPVTADYLAAVIGRADEEDAALLVVELDTPGGLDSAMRQMVQAILKSRVPVAVYVSPQGARAASAGVLITLAADVAAMAPGTNIGAARTPRPSRWPYTSSYSQLQSLPDSKEWTISSRPSPARSRVLLK